ncbi:unnamed protein product [Pylaiella littoralis]
MAFFVGDLVVSVSGCSLDDKEGRLLDPCVELSVGNKLHSTRLPVNHSDGVHAEGGRNPGGKRASPSPAAAVAFHGVTEGDVLTITVLDRSPSSATTAPDGRSAPPFIAEAEPLRCTHWGAGGRPTRRTCVVLPPREEEGAQGSGGGGARARAQPRAGARAGAGGPGVSTVQVAICWSPAIRLRRPLALLARAGSLTGRRISRKIDGPVAAVLDLGLGAAEKASDLMVFRSPWWRAAAVLASAASLSVGSAFLAAWAAFFLPVALALSAATVAALATFAPPVLAFCWVLACTRPACEQLWRPLLVWAGTRWGFLRDALLLPVEVGGARGRRVESGGEEWEGGDRGVLLGGHEASLVDGEDSQRSLQASSLAEGQQAEEPPNAMIPLGRGGGGRGNGGALTSVTDAGAVVLLLACYQNLIGVLHTGLKASRWRPHPR